MDHHEFKQVVRQGFDQASVGYDSPAMRFFDHSAEHLVEALSFKGDEHLLDVACGTGKVALNAARKLRRGKVTGIDLSEGMLERARAKAKSANIKNVVFENKDVEDLAFPQNTFNGVLCSFGMFFFSDMPSVLRKLIPMLKPNGFIAMTSFADGSFRPHSEMTLERFKQYGVKLPESYTWQRLDSQGKHFQLFNGAGLKNIYTYIKPMGYYLPDENAWWDIVTYTGFRSFLNQLSPEDAERYKKEHLEEIAKTAEPGKGIRLRVDVIFTMAYK